MGRRKYFLGRRKFSNGNYDIIPLQIFFDINQHKGPTNTSYKMSEKMEKMTISLVLLFLVTAAILISRPD